MFCFVVFLVTEMKFKLKGYFIYSQPKTEMKKSYIEILKNN